jgi:N,N'-diacetyllegionaminate synthase
MTLLRRDRAAKVSTLAKAASRGDAGRAAHLTRNTALVRAINSPLMPRSSALPILFLVLARGGSRRVPGKNLRTVAGIPLVAWAVRTARAAAAVVPGGPHSVVCSTDDPAIAACAAAWHAEVPFLRPAALADDAASSIDGVLHALDALAAAGRHVRAVALLQPTSPLTDPADVAAAIARFDETGAPVVAVTPTHPGAWHQTMDETGVLRSAEPADARTVLSGAFYVIAPDELRSARQFVIEGRTRGVIVPPERSVDVDEDVDLVVANALAGARPVRVVPLADRIIGGGSCLVIAEAGVNHNGDPALAHRLIDAAADAGADVVKFQTFDPARLAAAGAPTAAYQRAAGEGAHDQREMLARLALPPETWAALQAHARDRGLVFLSSPFDEASADLLDRLDVPAFKVASGELTNTAFIDYLARKGRPLLVSTGMADMVDVADALETIVAAGAPPVALFHCVSAYPARPEDANLRAIGTLRAAFGVPAGWSDHTPGIELAIAAVALGADLLEKHITLDRALPGPDHAASLEPGELAAMVTAVRASEAARGSGEKVPVAAEREVASVARRSLHWAMDGEAGAIVNAMDVVALRPGTGIPPRELSSVVGRRLARPVAIGHAVQREDLSDDPA